MKHSIENERQQRINHTKALTGLVWIALILSFCTFYLVAHGEATFTLTGTNDRDLTVTGGTIPEGGSDYHARMRYSDSALATGCGATGDIAATGGYDYTEVWSLVGYDAYSPVILNFYPTTADATAETNCYGYIKVEWNGSDWDAEAFDGTEDLVNTRIIEIIPGNDEVIATTSLPMDLEVEYFISDEDYEDYGNNDFIRVRYRNNTTSIVFSGIHAISAVTDPWEQTYEEEIVGSGYITFSTSTSPEQVGRYTVEAELIRPTYSFLGFEIGETRLAYFTDSFIIATTTQYDKIKDETGSEIEALGLSGIESSCGEELSILSPIKFTVCLFAFDGTGIAQVLINAREGFLTRVPFGYVNRMYELLTSSATTSLPTISYTFASGPLAGAELAFDPWDHFYVDGSVLKDEIVSNDGGENIWEVVEPFYEIVVYLTLSLLVFKKLTGIHLKNSHKPE